MSNANSTGARGLQYTGTLAAAPPNCNFVDRDPTPYDNKGYSLLDQWLNTTTNDGWVLVSLAQTNVAGTLHSLALWVKFTGAGLPGILSITGDDGIPIFPASNGNFNIIGTTAIETSTGAPTFPNTLIVNVLIATEASLGVTTLANSTVTIDGTSRGSAVTPFGLSAKLGTQTLNGVAYGDGGIGTVIGWTDAGNVQQVLTSNGPLLPPSFQDVAEGFNVIAAVRVATTGALTATYANGAAGVGATLTNSGAQAAIVIDSVTLSFGDRVLVKNQASQLENGVYTVTNVGSGSTNWVLTRATDYDIAPGQIKPGNIVPVIAGTVNTNTIWLQTATVTTIGTDPIIFVGFGTQPIPLPTAEGGTSTTSFPVVNGVVIYNGTELTNVASTGTAGQVLVSNGAAAPTFQTIATGAGALVLIQTQTVTVPVQTVVFTGFSNTYNSYYFVFNGMDFTAGSSFTAAFLAQVSNNGGATYFVSGYLGGIGGALGNVNGSIPIASNNGFPCVQNATLKVTGDMWCYNLTSGGTPEFQGRTAYTVTGPNAYIATTYSNAVVAPNVNAIRFFWDDSSTRTPLPNYNIVAGTISMYGYLF